MKNIGAVKELTILGCGGVMGSKIRYMTTETAAKSWSLTKRTVAKYCRDGKIPAVFKQAGQWYIPVDALKPLLPRDERYFLILVLRLKNRPDFEIDYEYEGINSGLVRAVCEWLLQRGLIMKYGRSVSGDRLLYEVRLTKKGEDSAFSNAEKSLDLMRIVQAVAGIIPVVMEGVELVKKILPG